VPDAEDRLRRLELGLAEVALALAREIELRAEIERRLAGALADHEALWRRLRALERMGAARGGLRRPR
jgi:hypothetical protein